MAKAKKPFSEMTHEERQRAFGKAIRDSMKYYSLMESLPYGSPEWLEAQKLFRQAEQDQASICNF